MKLREALLHATKRPSQMEKGVSFFLSYCLLQKNGRGLHLQVSLWLYACTCHDEESDLSFIKRLILPCYLDMVMVLANIGVTLVAKGWDLIEMGDKLRES